MLEAPKKRLYLLSRVLFSVFILVLLVISLWFVLRSEINHIELEFEAEYDRLRSHITAQTRTYEVALEGFTAFVEVNRPLDMEKLRHYARLLQSYYPDLYAFELAKRVEEADRQAFEQDMRARYPGFFMHVFDYDDERQLKPVQRRDVYYPIVFVEPIQADYLDILGLDQRDENSLLSDVLRRSPSADRLLASRPVALIDGSMGYLMYRPVGIEINTRDVHLEPNREAYAMLVVRGRDLLPEWISRWGGVRVKLASVMDGAGDAPLVDIEQPALSMFLPAWLVPHFERHTQVGVDGQRFWLTVVYTPSLNDLNTQHLLVYAGFCSAALLMLVLVLRAFRISDNAQSRWQQFLYQRANFDQLTQLPNMNLLLDRLEQLMHRTVRTHQKLALLYIDLDGFKGVNDSWGHDIGDQLLFKVARRLEACLREQDTVARLHGDEFVVVLPGIESRAQAVMVGEKLNQEFSVPFNLGEHLWVQQISIGIVLYPDDGENIEELLSLSDRRMYRQKQAHHAGDNCAPDAWAD